MSKTQTNTGLAYLFRVILPAETEKESVWRTIALRPNNTLTDFHRAIFRAFEREEEHLWTFFFGKPYAANTLEYHSHIVDDPFSRPMVSPSVKLQELTFRRNSRIYYLFDYGDEWWHEIRFLGKQKAEPGKRYPKILEKYGEAPPQYPDYDEDNEDEFQYLDELLLELEDDYEKTGSVEIEGNLYGDLVHEMKPFKNAINPMRAVGFLRGAVCDEELLLPSEYVFLLTGIKKPREVSNEEHLRKLAAVCSKIEILFYAQLNLREFIPLGRTDYKDGLAGTFQKAGDFVYLIDGFINGLGATFYDIENLDDLPEKDIEGFKTLAELRIILSEYAGMKSKQLEREFKASTDNLFGFFAKIDLIVTELIAGVSIAFQKAFGPEPEEFNQSSFSSRLASPDAGGVKIYMPKGKNLIQNIECICGSGKKFKDCCGKEI